MINWKIPKSWPTLWSHVFAVQCLYTSAFLIMPRVSRDLAIRGRGVVFAPHRGRLPRRAAAAGGAGRTSGGRRRGRRRGRPAGGGTARSPGRRQLATAAARHPACWRGPAGGRPARRTSHTRSAWRTHNSPLVATWLGPPRHAFSSAWAIAFNAVSQKNYNFVTILKCFFESYFQIIDWNKNIKMPRITLLTWALRW